MTITPLSLLWDSLSSYYPSNCIFHSRLHPFEVNGNKRNTESSNAQGCQVRYDFQALADVIVWLELSKRVQWEQFSLTDQDSWRGHGESQWEPQAFCAPLHGTLKYKSHSERQQLHTHPHAVTPSYVLDELRATELQSSTDYSLFQSWNSRECFSLPNYIFGQVDSLSPCLI